MPQLLRLFLPIIKDFVISCQVRSFFGGVVKAAESMEEAMPTIEPCKYTKNLHERLNIVVTNKNNLRENGDRKNSK